MTQELNLVINVNGNKPQNTQLATKNELLELHIETEKLILDKNNLNLITSCANCSHNIQLNVFWHSNDIKTGHTDQPDKNLTQDFEMQICAEVKVDEKDRNFAWDEPHIMIKEEPSSGEQSSDQSDKDRKSCRSSSSEPVPVKVRKKRKRKEVRPKIKREDLPEMVFYPGMTYLLPAGLDLPPLKDVRAPYFNTAVQKDGATVYIEKKRQKKWPVRVTNYDPRLVRCDICDYEVPSSDRMTAHRRGHMFFKFSDVECRGCGIFCGSKPEEKVNHSFFCPGKDSLNGLQCIECDYEAPEYKALRAHMKNKHKGYNPAPETNRDKQVRILNK